MTKRDYTSEKIGTSVWGATNNGPDSPYPGVYCPFCGAQYTIYEEAYDEIRAKGRCYTDCMNCLRRFYVHYGIGGFHASNRKRCRQPGGGYRPPHTAMAPQS